MIMTKRNVHDWTGFKFGSLAQFDFKSSNLKILVNDIDFVKIIRESFIQFKN